jgi:Mrp family chromosome partitioning ATPase
MSRLSDALRRAEGRDPHAELLRQADRATSDTLWGIDRPDTAVLEVPAPPVAFERSSLRKRDEVFEQYLGTLVDRVFLPISGEPTRFVAFASTGPEVKSSALTATAAVMLAERTTRTVCVVDANFRSPSVHEHFGVPNAAGLAEGLSSDGPLLDRARRVQRNLWVLPAGEVSGRPAFDTAAARQRITQFVAQFDYVLVDVEPVAAGLASAGLLRLVGGVIVVVAADATRREIARRATQALAESGVTVMGAVLMNRQLPVPTALDRLL